MKTNFYLVLYVFIITACIQKTDKSIVSNTFVPEGKGYIKFYSTSPNDSIDLTLWYFKFLPFEHEAVHFVTSDTLIAIETHFPLIVNMFGKSQMEDNIRFMILPNDTIYVHYDRKGNNGLKDCIHFGGETKSVSNYLTSSKLYFLYEVPRQNESPSDYNSRIDSLQFKALEKLKVFNANTELPEWFKEYEKTDIHFLSEYLKRAQYQNRYGLYHQVLKREEDPSDAFDNTLKRNLWVTDNLFSYISSFRSVKYDSLLSNLTDSEYVEYTQNNINSLVGKLPSKVLSYAIAAKLSHLIDYGNLSRLTDEELIKKSNLFDSLLKINYPILTDTEVLNYLKIYKEKQFQKLFARYNLNLGDKVPAFSLRDINGVEVNSTGLQGNLVCLNFWNLHCSPCIGSIPMKNKLVEKYSSKGFLLVNICLDNNEPKWRELISDKKFKGIHLRCINNQAQKLVQEFAITGYPHYTFINSKGLIISNKIHGDSLEYFVKHNL
jgi:thiol-disulfide isomerase/thioredoxin